jgi:hypothetical protein
MLKNQGTWKGQVRIVALNNYGRTPHNIIDDSKNFVHWDRIENLELHK